MTAAVGARNLFKVDAGVVHALLQARYQNSSRGQFISEDPVFLGDPRQQVLTAARSLNSYSYANDNPIRAIRLGASFVKTDVSVKFWLLELCNGGPVIRTALTTGLVSADFKIGSNGYQQTTGNPQNAVTVGGVNSAFGQGFAFGAAAEKGAGFVSPLAAPFFRTARGPKLFGQTVSAGAVTARVDTVNGNSSPWQIAGDTGFSMISTWRDENRRGATRFRRKIV